MMNQIEWIKTLIESQGEQVPVKLEKMINNGCQNQGPFRFVTYEQGRKDTDRMNSMFPSHHVAAFARDVGNDGVICLVIEDCDYPKGSVLVLRWDSWPGTEVNEDYASLATWAKSAEAEITLFSKRGDPET